MAESSTILASLDPFIETFKTERGVEIGHSAATGKHGVAIIKAAENQEFGHFDHCGHSELDKCADDEHDPDLGDKSDIVMAPKILFSNGNNGNSGQTQENCGFDRDHRTNGIGHNGHSGSDRQTSVRPNVAHDQGDIAGPLFDADLEVDPEHWRQLYDERAAIREYEGGYSRAEAEGLAWGEVELRWHMAHHGPAVPGVCAGCRRPITDEAVISLIDGNKVHDRRDMAASSVSASTGAAQRGHR
jgi:hypothetical protein